MRRLLVLLVLAATACATTDPMDHSARQTPRHRYAGTAIGHPVGAIPEVMIRDAARNRDIELTIDYPIDGAANPLIIFSPGFGASNDAYVGLSAYWAGAGYVVIRPAHADAAIRPDDLAEAWRTQTPAQWQDRVRDISFVLDSLDVLEQRYPELVGKIDRSRVGVGGHSHGAFTAMLIGGARTFPGGTSYRDPRVKAIIAMSPPGPSSERGLTAESWNELTIPTLFMTGSRDVGLTEAEGPQWRREAFDRAAAGDKWLVVVEGAQHGSFTGRLGAVLEERIRVREQMEPPPLAAPNQRRTPVTDPAQRTTVVRERTIFDLVKGLSLAFWDTYLRDSAEARAELERNRGGVAIERR